MSSGLAAPCLCGHQHASLLLAVLTLGVLLKFRGFQTVLVRRPVILLNWPLCPLCSIIVSNSAVPSLLKAVRKAGLQPGFVAQHALSGKDSNSYCEAQPAVTVFFQINWMSQW